MNSWKPRYLRSCEETNRSRSTTTRQKVSSCPAPGAPLSAASAGSTCTKCSLCRTVLHDASKNWSQGQTWQQGRSYAALDFQRVPLQGQNEHIGSSVVGATCPWLRQRCMDCLHVPTRTCMLQLTQRARTLEGVKPGMSRASTVVQTECSRGWLAVEDRSGSRTFARCSAEKNAAAASSGWLAAAGLLVVKKSAAGG